MQADHGPVITSWRQAQIAIFINMKVVVRGLTKVYTTSQGDVRAIGGVNLDVHDREFFGIIGPTGCGKTTLLHVIGRLEAPTTGTVEFVGEQRAKSPVSMVFQRRGADALADGRRKRAFGRGVSPGSAVGV